MKGRPFIHEDFLLETDAARDLYHGVAERLPIIDFHSHLPPDAIAENRRFSTLTEVWIKDDHYKWRAMRACGVDERFCTGDAGDWEKFEAWAKTVPDTLRNPLYHWTHMELAHPFGISDRLLDGSTARYVYDKTRELLQRDDFRAQGLLRHFGVVVACTTDDPTDTLEHHVRHRAVGAEPRMLPTWRSDNALAVEDTGRYAEWLSKLERSADIAISSLDALLEALARRHAFFHATGCRISDCGLEAMCADDCTERDARAIFKKVRAQRTLEGDEVVRYKSFLLHELAVMDHDRGWTQQFHLGALRNANTRFLRSVGPNTGHDTIGDAPFARPLARFLCRLDAEGKLAQTILYNLNPRDNEVFAAMIGCFQDGVVPGKIQYGSAWWFLDQLDGMRKQLDALSNLGLLSQFVGMVTDSRSFLSFSRHEYFRRLLCSMLGEEVRRGVLPDDRPLLARLIERVCFENARRYLGLLP